MAVTTANMIQGAGTLYHGDFGETEPLDTAINAAPAGPAWTDVGATLGGIVWRYNPTFAELDADQLVDVAGSRLVKRENVFVTQLAEPTLDLLVVAMNGEATITTSAGPAASTSWEPDTAAAASNPTYKAWILDGLAEGTDKRRRIIIRKGLMKAQFELAYKKDEQTVIPVEIHAHYVSSSIKPFKIVDET